MNSYSVKQTPGTAGSIVIAGVLAGQILASISGIGSESAPHAGLRQVPYSTQSNLPSFGQFSNLFTGGFGQSEDSFVENVTNFYAKLLAAQEPLGVEFERVLHDNLWSLYES